MKKIAVLSLTFACALAFGGSYQPNDNTDTTTQQLRHNLDRLEIYSSCYNGTEQNFDDILLDNNVTLYSQNGNC